MVNYNESLDQLLHSTYDQVWGTLLKDSDWFLGRKNNYVVLSEVWS